MEFTLFMGKASLPTLDQKNHILLYNLSRDFFVKYLSKTESISIPQRLHCIPLKDTIIFPYVVAPLFLQSEEALTVLNKSALESNLIGCVYQRAPLPKDPQPKELLSLGTVCRILQLVKLPNKGMKVFVEGISRVFLQNIVQETPYLRADVREVVEPEEKSPLSETLVQSIGTLFKIFLSAGRPLPDEALKTLDQIEHPGRLADLIAITLRPGLKDQQEIFETIDPLERLKKVFDLFSREFSSFPLRPHLLFTGRKETGKMQREHPLRSSMKGQREAHDEDPYLTEIHELREKVQAAGMPQKVEEIAHKEIYRLERMNPISAEYTVSRTYLDYLIHIPWDKKTTDNLDLERAQTVLNEDHYDLEKVKDRIIEFLAVKKLKDPMKGPILCFVGPPGVGKTSLGRSIARALERKFIRISLGGVRDEAEVRGHRRTYVGALPGRIIQEMKRAGTSNPVFMLDEVDKIGQDVRGDPAAALLEALDPEQNFSFTDHYLDVPFDLSHVLFITTANTLSPIPPPLLDRMEVIRIPGYTEEEKEKIGFQFLIAHQKEENGLKDHPLSFTTEAVYKIIREYTREAGVRNLEREIATVCRKIAKEVALGNQPEEIVNESVVEGLLGPRKFFREVAQEKDRIGVATGLAWTENGGDIIFIETSKMKGDKGLLLTGSLGEVMKESAQAALSYIRANARSLEVPENFYQEWDIHIHIPAGATPKDGPSAGIAIATAVLSLLKERPVAHDVAMTGELTLSGRVLPVGGIKEKILAGRRAGVKTILLPKKNEENLEDIPEYVKKEMNFILVEHIQEVLDFTLPS
ncbi:MAG: endopeptidase La [Syntrophaceae bacterium]|nr:endopeptidase La [Syntrophaceae bacterium]